MSKRIRMLAWVVAVLVAVSLWAAPAMAAHVIESEPEETPVVTQAPTPVPTEAPTPEPTPVPTEVPTEAPTPEPTPVPTEVPTEAPTAIPTEPPTEAPTEAPTPEPEAAAPINWLPSASADELGMVEAEEPAPVEDFIAPAVEIPPVDWNMVNLEDGGFQIDLVPNQMEMVSPGQYMYALHRRTEGYNRKSVLISGLLYAPEGTQIVRAIVTPAGGQPHVVEGNAIVRFRSGVQPESVNMLQFTPDEGKAGFAFLVDLSSEKQLTDGDVQVTVKLVFGQNAEPELDTTVVLQAPMGRYDYILRAIRSQCIGRNDQGDQVNEIQARLAELGFLDTSAMTGICDEGTIAAANELLGAYGKGTNSEFLTAEAVGFIESGTPGRKGESTGDGGFFKKTVSLFGADIPLWVLIAAGLALVLIILLVLLLIILKKRKKARQQYYPPAMGDMGDSQPFITGADEDEEPTGKILTIGDEPTMELGAAGGIMMNADEPTTDLADQVSYILKLRLIFGDQYMDQDLSIQDGIQLTIGRDASAAIRTNPGDTSVSHRHGSFSINQGMLQYTDNSRNGTRFNNQRTLHHGDTVNIPLNTKAQLDIGAHKVLVMAIQK